MADWEIIRTVPHQMLGHKIKPKAHKVLTATYVKDKQPAPREASYPLWRKLKEVNGLDGVGVNKPFHFSPNNPRRVPPSNKDPNVVALLTANITRLGYSLSHLNSTGDLCNTCPAAISTLSGILSVKTSK